ncbi:MAG: hypothetical protein P8I74_01440, partial [Phycisphaerales bacterium]|nr:hypothetical protein [Phycisphaerales bacterium]
MLSMPNTKNRRPFARFNRASVSLVAGLGLAAASLALAQEGPVSVERPVDRPASKTDKTVKPLGKVETKRAGEQQAKPAAEKPAAEKGRMVIGASDVRSPGKPVVDNQYLQAPQVLNLADEAGAFQVNPVTGMGMIFSPDGTPLLLQLEPAVETIGWIGHVLGEDLS